MSRRHGDDDSGDEEGGAPSSGLYPTSDADYPEEEAAESKKQHTRAILFHRNVLPHVMRWLRGLAVRPRDRADVAGDVWLAAVASWPTFDTTRGHPLRWLNRIAVHVASHYHDRARHRREESLEALLEPRPHEHEDPWTMFAHVARCTDDRAADRLDESIEELLCLHDPAPDAFACMAHEQDRIRVLEALQALDERSRNILVSHDIEGISMNRIAKSMGVPVSTLYKWRAKALTAFRVKLEEAKIDESV
jgi:RNA polymerase sigma-70 factor, ECF subfamily